MSTPTEPSTPPPCPACTPPLPTQHQQPEKRKKKPIGCMVAVGVLAFLYLLGKTASPTAEQQPEQQASTAAPQAETPAAQATEPPQAATAQTPAPTPAPQAETPAKPKLTLDTITRADFERHAASFGDALCEHIAVETLLTRRIESVTDTSTANSIAQQLPSLIEKRAKAESDMMIALAGIYDKLAAATGEDVLAVAESGKNGHLRDIINDYSNRYDYNSSIIEQAERRETCIKRLAARRYYGSSLLESTLSKLTH